jgi:acetate kinase
MKILVLNAGSSTLKFSLIDSDGERVLASGVADWSAEPAHLTVRRSGQTESDRALSIRRHADAVQPVLAELERDSGEITAVGHRVVHGGERYTASVVITPEVRRAIGELGELAPLHNPASLEGIETAMAALPNVPHVAVFDTAFHATIPEHARLYPLPYAWYAEWGLRRYGFHGLSHAYCVRRTADMLKRSAAGLRLVTCHLGNGCSIAAVRDGKCVDTSMGYTPMEGLMMGTRSGSVDPGLLLHVLRHKGLTVEQLDHVLNEESGLLGVSGISSDMREVLAAARTGHARAQLAVDIFAHRARRTIGAMAATLGDVDALVFTAGIGENAPEVRAQICTGLGFLGLELDASANAECEADADVATSFSKGRILVIETREDLMIVRETVRLLRRVV